MGDMVNDIYTNTLEIIKNSRYRYLSEASTTSLVSGILYSYGWNVFDPSEVEPQFTFYNKRPDLAIKLFEKRKIYIEIKKYEKNLNQKDIKQLEGYLKETPDVQMGFLSNSRTWWFYISSKDENNDIKIVRKDQIDLLKDSDSNIQKFFSNNLSKDKMVDEWYQTNIEILGNHNCLIDQKNAAIYNLRKMKDIKVIDALEKTFFKEEDDTIRLNALNGIVHLSGIKDPKPVLEKALDDQSTKIREKAKEYLDLLKKQQEADLNHYKNKLGL